MRSAQIVALAAFAGSALAAPQWGQWRGQQQNGGAPQVTEVAVVTQVAYTTVTENGPAPTAAPQAQGGQFYGNGGRWGQGRPSQPDQSQPEQPTAAASTWVSVPSAPSGGSSGGYMGIVNEFRSKMGHPELTEDSKLQGNALKTAQDGNGQMVHELNPGTMAQVLAPGSADEFEKVYVGGWLCEVPSAAGLDGICGSMSAGWAYNGETGHADILNSNSYSKIGCANAGGIWACDLA